MVQQLITQHLDIWTAAHKTRSSAGRGSSNKLDLYGIKKLRELILELAVRGKLVPQEAGDEPASELLKRIAVKKVQLIKDGKIKKEKSYPEITDEEQLLNIPKSWKLVRFGDVYDVRDGTHDSPKSQLTGYPLITSKNLSSGKLDFSDVNYISEEDHLKIIDRSRVDRDDVLFAMIGTIGSPVIVDCDVEFSIKNVALFKYYTRELSVPEFLKAYLSLAAVKLKAESLGGVQAFVSLGKLRTFVMPLPPLAEQHRIVAKVDELMAFCDELEHTQSDNIAAHAQLVEVMLATLTASTSYNELQTNWQRIAEHFDTLFTTEHSLDQLKQTILQLAVMGKLVPQNPNDEPASELLKKITTEKMQLIKEGKIKKLTEYIDFDGLSEIKKMLPESWEWIRLAETADIVRGGSPRPAGDPRFYGGSIPFLKVGDITNNKGKFVEGFNATITEAGLTKTRYINSKTVLLSNSGATLGVPAICDFPATFNDGIAAFVEKSEFILDEYLYLYLKSLSKWLLDVASQGQGQPNLNTDIIKSVWFPLPPINEQQKIVTRVDELMALCDALKANLQNAQSTQLALADTLVESVTGSRVSVISNGKPQEIAMNITTPLEVVSTAVLESNALLASIIKSEGRELDAKQVWRKSKLDLPSFYKQLKMEIEAGYIVKPAPAEF